MRDFDVRRELHYHLRSMHSKEPDTLILDELGVCQGVVRMDLAVVNGSLAGYEIKSDRDTLARLPLQAELYSAVLDYATLVVGERHIKRATLIVPPWWGIIVATVAGDGLTLSRVRPPQLNHEIRPERLVELLWRDEVLQALVERDVADGVRSKPRRVLWQRLADELPLDELRALVRQCLKSRVGWRSD
jgi:hypothetical protein